MSSRDLIRCRQIASRISNVLLGVVCVSMVPAIILLSTTFFLWGIILVVISASSLIVMGITMTLETAYDRRWMEHRLYICYYGYGEDVKLELIEAVRRSRNRWTD